MSINRMFAVGVVACVVAATPQPVTAAEACCSKKESAKSQAAKPADKAVAKPVAKSEAAAQSVAQPAGLRIAIDEKGNRIAPKAPTISGAPSLTAAQAALKQEPAPNPADGFMVRLGAAGRYATIATVTAEGKVQLDCIQTSGEEISQ